MIFVSSFISLSNYSSNSHTATTSIPQAAYGQATSNGVVSGYGTQLSINISCSNAMQTNKTITNTTSLLTKLENNNTVFNFYNTNSNFQVVTGNVSSYAVYKYFAANANAMQFGCMSFTGPAYIILPPALNYTVGAQKVQIPLPPKDINNTLTIPLSKGIGTTLKLRISSLITVNGTVYGPLSISLAQ